MKAQRSFLFAITLVFCLIAAGSALAAPPPGGVFTYRRVFKSSSPEFIEIKINEGSDQSTYEIRQLDDDPGALPFEVSSALRSKIFELIAELSYFRGLDLDVHRKIANLGEKTFRWDRDGQTNEVRFNYTVNTAATQLLQICEGLARQQELIELLQRLVGRMRGGLNVVMVTAMVLFSGISGSKMADVAAVGAVLVPASRKSGQNPGSTVALLAASAVMAETIPPCINLIILGFVANLSIGGLFVAGLLPARRAANLDPMTALREE